MGIKASEITGNLIVCSTTFQADIKENIKALHYGSMIFPQQNKTRQDPFVKLFQAVRDRENAVL